MRAERGLTISDVAREAEVSIGTVSHVLNGTTNVSAALRARVEAAKIKLGYEQNMLAHAQRRQRAPVVGLSAPHVGSAYLAALIEAFEDHAALRGYQVMQVLTRRDPQVELRRVRELLRHRVAGLLLITTYDPRETLAAIDASRTPAVLVDRPCGDDRFDEVTFDNRAVTTEAASRLAKLGHRDILFVVQSQRLSVTKLRVEALRERAAAFARGRLRVEVLEIGDDPPEQTERLKRALRAAPRPLAVIVSNSVVAAMTLHVLRDFPQDYPERISLLSFEAPEWADLTSPRLSVIRQPVQDIANDAWELLLRRMQGERFPAQRIERRAAIEFSDSVRKATP
jgi:LacI family transcriptional regulator